MYVQENLCDSIGLGNMVYCQIEPTYLPLGFSIAMKLFFNHKCPSIATSTTTTKTSTTSTKKTATKTTTTKTTTTKKTTTTTLSKAARI